MYVSRYDQIVLVHTPAKLNLFLEVLARRDDGFHEIETLMAPIGIFDTLCFANNPDGRLHLDCSWGRGVKAMGAGGQSTKKITTDPDHCEATVRGGLPDPHDNIVYRVLEGIRSKAGKRFGATVGLVKRIPSAAGLGGASSDAAAAIVAANQVWQLGWSRDELTSLASQFGSDVPFFIRGGTAICRGRGEIVEPVAGVGRQHVVVVRPPTGLATAEVYRHCRVPDHPFDIRSRLAAQGPLRNVMFNRLQEPAEQLAPAIRVVREALARLDCGGHQLSGSGSSYFGICRSARHAKSVASYLRHAGLGTVFSAATLPLFERRP